MKKLAFSLALALAAGPLFAQPAPAARYVCGGIGEEEQKTLKEATGHYDLALTFATAGGAYLADVNVVIKDANGANVLSVRCGGPLMLVTLAGAGTWEVSAQVNGATQTKTLKAGGTGKPVSAGFVLPG